MPRPIKIVMLDSHRTLFGKFDVHSRQEVWDLFNDLANQGIKIYLLLTQRKEELANRPPRWSSPVERGQWYLHQLKEQPTISAPSRDSIWDLLNARIFDERHPPNNKRLFLTSRTDILSEQQLHKFDVSNEFRITVKALEPEVKIKLIKYQLDQLNQNQTKITPAEVLVVDDNPEVIRLATKEGFTAIWCKNLDRTDDQAYGAYSVEEKFPEFGFFYQVYLLAAQTHNQKLVDLYSQKITNFSYEVKAPMP